ncbi:hypothetical protein SRB5_23240 [Streptomyces sp. RB5]|uniref:DUF3515 domain-containing protein n=1 Tax=Streptomyces smaragdinus TaxID=2585196 RepID=A0A7K0CHG9_9ACTN|nr:hypothetical protein [Streptomyces smaragdinus]
MALAAGCSPDDDGKVAVPAPRPSGEAVAHCAALAKRLPRALDDDLRRRTVKPESRYTAAWGDPAVVLRCGVRRPAVLTPGTELYNPSADTAEVDGVDWLLEDTDEGYRFTTVGRRTFVEVAVPEHYAPEIGIVAGGISAAVRATVPTEL